MNARGAKTTIVASVEDVIAAATSFVADKAASNFDSPICICR